jgi:hypothetical protein
VADTVPDAVRRLVVLGTDAVAVGRIVRELRESGARVAAFVGEDEELARELAAEVLGGLDDVVRVGPSSP